MLIRTVVSDGDERLFNTLSNAIALFLVLNSNSIKICMCKTCLLKLTSSIGKEQHESSDDIKLPNYSLSFVPKQHHQTFFIKTLCSHIKEFFNEFINSILRTKMKSYSLTCSVLRIKIKSHSLTWSHARNMSENAYYFNMKDFIASFLKGSYNEFDIHMLRICAKLHFLAKMNHLNKSYQSSLVLGWFIKSKAI